MPRTLLAFSLVYTLCAPVVAQENQACPICRQTAAGRPNEDRQILPWQAAETVNFRVYCCCERDGIQNLAERCESLRNTLQHRWLGDSREAAWSPRCDVIVHPSRDSYLKAVGMGGGQTSGASLIEIRAGAVAVRRIDLLGGRTGCETSALPHELTHVILADRFHDRRIPPWADEGAAVLADSAEKQRLHLRDLAEAEASGTTFDIGCLFGLDCPSSSQCGTFYGQSLSVVNFLVQRGSPQQFVQFVRQATQVGYDRALSESYGIRGVIELDRLWRHDSFSPDGRQELRPSSHGSIHRRFG